MIKTKRLLLREFTPGDWKSVHDYATHPAAYEFMPWGPNTEQETKQFIEKAINEKGASQRTSYEFAIIHQEKNKLIGGFGLKCDPQIEYNCEIGYCLSPDYWGNYFAMEGVTGLITYAFKVLSMHRIYAVVDPKNSRSIKLLEKLQFRKEGVFKEHKFIRHKWRDSNIYAILNSEWNST